MKVVALLFDSLNRDALSCYEPGTPRTPNFERLAARSVQFDRHFGPTGNSIVIGPVDWDQSSCTD